ncbi:MAG: Isoleucyl-tRNA synthetase [Candidatus Curtissbacteria bacterium GW2011_GWA1_41_11]|uniref:Isoleucine--tRNA ligase n=1 Tax=Candidatus Curtissbacteria bacterium GW2011_GWA1_41_11 TaxID=1618409 RepID=A0A0G0UBE6_9BACT|nr:MAG: Isoleucyl-tRNA synthetase [Candidatus Curtissbacteria bacterium GW2011_GWA1_41_11]
MVKKTRYKPVDPKQDFVEMEKRLLKYWYEEGIIEKYLAKNLNSKKKFSFLDGPITANNPMGVHHAWGRTYKDLWQRFYNMQGFAQRFQNGFDEQGLWIEVEVEKELGFKNKKDIEKYGIAKFVEKCKERVKKYSQMQTEQSKRLGYFMDWDNSYHTSSDENNYAIWNFLKVCHKKGYLYKGRDSVPWCPRCGTAISQHEILTEEYQEITHKAVYVKYRVKESKSQRVKGQQFLLVWTTTPWTLPSNVSIAVNPDLNYGLWTLDGEAVILETSRAKAIGIKEKPEEKFRGSILIGFEYEGIFDELPVLRGVKHKIVSAKDLVTAEEGTGLVHIAPGAGEEDFHLAKDENLQVIESIDESANYIDGFGDLTGKNAKNNPDLIIEKLSQKGVLFKQENYKHRYPTCWRCKTELVWRVVNEWYIAMDKKDPDDQQGRTLRKEMVDVAKKIRWIPKFGLERELDWLKNMHDWLISKKRYWGLALPIWECQKCGYFEVLGSKDELGKKAVTGWNDFEGKSPHRPQIDAVKIKCPKCAYLTSRIPDVGNVWLDAGIVPISTMSSNWYPADFITESFPGQFKNWFYSMIAMCTVIKNVHPYKTVLGFATLLDEKGEEMHKSKGNAIEFNEAADKIGVDVMRWMYLRQNPVNNLLFGYHKADEVRRRFYLILWNVYSFFVTYANLDDWKQDLNAESFDSKNVLDGWIISRLNSTMVQIMQSLTDYNAQLASQTIEDFVIGDFSTWYVRRSRDRVGEALPILYSILVSLSKVIAPFMPYVAEEMYMNLTGGKSVHLADFPQANSKFIDLNLEKEMKKAREIAEKAHAKRKEAQIKVRQPLQKLEYAGHKLLESLELIIADEINVKNLIHAKTFKLDTKLSPQLKAEGEVREIIRRIQQARKETGCDLAEKVTVILPAWPKEFEEEIKKQTLAKELIKGEKLAIKRAG